MRGKAGEEEREEEKEEERSWNQEPMSPDSIAHSSPCRPRDSECLFTFTGQSPGKP